MRESERFMKNAVRLTAVLFVVICVTAAMSQGSAYSGRKLNIEHLKGSLATTGHSRNESPLMAAIFSPEVIRAASKLVPGRVFECKLEEEDGFLVYGVEIITDDGVFMEIQVDAGNGRVLSSEEDKPEKENDICEKLGCA